MNKLVASFTLKLPACFALIAMVRIHLITDQKLAFAAIIVSKRLLTILTVLGDLQQKTNFVTENLDTCASASHSKSTSKDSNQHKPLSLMIETWPKRL